MYQVIVFAAAIVATTNAVIEVGKTAFTDCGKEFDDVTMHFKNFAMKPDPVRWPGNATASLNLVVDEELPANLVLKLTIKRSSPIGYIYIPCIKPLAFGSCDLGVCQEFFPQYKDMFCRKARICECPIQRGKYEAKDFILPLPEDPLIGQLMIGKYQGRAKFVDANDETKVYGCLNISYEIAKTPKESNSTVPIDY